MNGNHIHQKLIFTILFVFLLIPACGSDESLEHMKEKIKYRQKLEEAEGNLERKLAELRTEAETAGEETAIAIENQIMDLESLQERLNKKLGEMEQVPDSDWKGLKADIDKLLEEYDEKLQSLEEV